MILKVKICPVKVLTYGISCKAINHKVQVLKKVKFGKNSTALLRREHS